MPTNVNRLLDGILRAEGGFTNDPSDAGHRRRRAAGSKWDSYATNRGVTQFALSEFLGRQATLEEVQNLTEDQARAVYKRDYFTRPGLEKLPPGLQEVMLDGSINHGPGAAIRQLQRVLRQFGFDTAVDGGIGPQTIEHAYQAARLHGRGVADALIEHRRDFYKRLARDPRRDDANKLAGWMNRMDDLQARLGDGPAAPTVPLDEIEPGAGAVPLENADPFEIAPGFMLAAAVAGRAPTPPAAGFPAIPDLIMSAKERAGLGYNPSDFEIDRREYVPILDPAQDIDTVTQAAAVLGLENVVGAGALYMNLAPGLESNPAPGPNLAGYNVLDHLTDEELANASEYLDAHSPRQLEIVRMRKRNEATLRHLAAEGPVNEVLLTALAVLADPVTYIPFFGQARAAGRIGAAATRFAARGAVEVGISEGLLQGFQEDRRLTESIGAVLLGGTIAGAAGAGLAKAAIRKQAVEDFADTVRAAASDEHGGLPLPDQTLTRVQPNLGNVTPVQLTDDELTEAGSVLGIRRMAASLEKAGYRGLAAGVNSMRDRTARLIGPSLEVLTSPFPSLRNNFLRLVDPAVLTKGQLRGVGHRAAVENKADKWKGLSLLLSQKMKELHGLAKQEGFAGSMKDFVIEVGRVGNKGDRHANPRVQEAAQWIRKNVADFTLESGVKAGIWDPAEVKTAESYFPRMGNVALINAEQDAFDEAIVRWLRDEVFPEQIAKAQAKLTKARTELDAAKAARAAPTLPTAVTHLTARLKKAEEAFAQAEADAAKAFDEKAARSIAADVRRNYVGVASGRLPSQVKLKERGPFKERVFNIPDHYIDRWMEKDALKVYSRYLNTFGPDIEMFKEFGKVNPTDDIVKELVEEADALIQATDNLTERQRLTRLRDRQVDLVKFYVDRVRNIDTRPVDGTRAGLRKAGTIFRNVNFMRLLGGVTIGSVVPDIATMAFQQGFSRIMRGAVLDAASGFRGTRLAQATLQRHAEAADWTTASTMRALLDISERTDLDTALDRAVNLSSKGSMAFARWGTFLPLWNEWGKSFASAVRTSDALEAIEAMAAGKKVGSRMVSGLGEMGIDPAMAARIAKEAPNFDRQGTLIFGNTDAWADRGAADAFEQGLLRTARRDILTPGIGDLPKLVQENPTLFQFKKFAVASTNRLLISGLQRRDLAALNGAMLLFAGGAMTVMLRDAILHGEVRDLSQDGALAEFARDAVDRSGLIALAMEGDALLDKLPLIPGVSQVVAGRAPSRFQSRGILARALGPTAGLLGEDIPGLFSAIEAGDGEQAARKLRRIVPLVNTFYMSYLLDQLMEDN